MNNRHYTLLPSTLAVHDRISCPAHYPHPAIYEVMKVDGERVWICNEAGLMLHGNFTVQLLRDYDYKLVVEEEKCLL